MPTPLLLSALCPLLVLGCSLSVLLSKSTGQGGQEFIHNHMDLRSEFFGELIGKDHMDAVGQKLRGEN